MLITFSEAFVPFPSLSSCYTPFTHANTPSVGPLCSLRELRLWISPLAVNGRSLLRSLEIPTPSITNGITTHSTRMLCRYKFCEK